jgi:DNA replication and repair protein RecF
VLASVAITQFRCLRAAEIELDPEVTLIIGRNASGKTSLLEALFFLGRGRSFRTRRLEHLIQRGQTEFRVVGRLTDDARGLVMGVQARRGGVEARVAGRNAQSLAELASYFAPQIIDPEVHKLLEEGPSRRRRFLDWGVFHVEQAFLETWQRFHRALRQRNAALKLGLPNVDVTVWDTELALAGEVLADQRQRYVDQLNDVVGSVGLRLLETTPSLRHDRGWDIRESLGEALRSSLDRDRRFRSTQVGPQRADVTVLVDGVPAKDRVSRGQQKMLAATLVLAQMEIQKVHAPDRSALLLDDPAAELDADNLARLMAVVADLNSQLVVTSLRPEVPGLPSPGKTFHVERGMVSQA